MARGRCHRPRSSFKTAKVQLSGFLRRIAQRASHRRFLGQSRGQGRSQAQAWLHPYSHLCRRSGCSSAEPYPPHRRADRICPCRLAQGAAPSGSPQCEKPRGVWGAAPPIQERRAAQRLLKHTQLDAAARAAAHRGSRRDCRVRWLELRQRGTPSRRLLARAAETPPEPGKPDRPLTTARTMCPSINVSLRHHASPLAAVSNAPT